MHSGTGITPNHVNDILGRYLPEVKDIVQLPGHDTLDYSYMLLTELRETLFNLLNQVSNPAVQLDNMISTTEMAYDELLAEVCRKQLANGLSTWQFEDDLRILKSQAELFAVVGLTDWYSETHKILKEIVNDSESE